MAAINRFAFARETATETTFWHRSADVNKASLGEMRPEEPMFAKGALDPADVERPAQRRPAHGGQLMENSMALKLASREQIIAVQPLPRPAMPVAAEDTGISRRTMSNFLLKGLHMSG